MSHCIVKSITPKQDARGLWFARINGAANNVVPRRCQIFEATNCTYATRDEFDIAMVRCYLTGEFAGGMTVWHLARRLLVQHADGAGLFTGEWGRKLPDELVTRFVREAEAINADKRKCILSRDDGGEGTRYYVRGGARMSYGTYRREHAKRMTRFQATLKPLSGTLASAWRPEFAEVMPQSALAA